MRGTRSAALFMLAVLPFLGGCGNFLRSDVVTFHEGPLPQGETIRVEAMDPEKASSLEFRSYALLVSAQLENIGYTPVSDPEARVELIAEMDYEVTPGPPELRVRRGMLYARYHFYDGRFRDPYYYGLYDTWPSEVYSTPSYVRILDLNIVRNDESRTRLFEGRVHSTGRREQLPEVMPYMITAMFTNFPGESGVTKVVTIEMD